MAKEQNQSTIRRAVQEAIDALTGPATTVIRTDQIQDLQASTLKPRTTDQDTSQNPPTS